jgi:hypothetical protein
MCLLRVVEQEFIVNQFMVLAHVLCNQIKEYIEKGQATCNGK